MLNAGIAGVGNLGKFHVASLLSMPDLVSVDALADPLEERRSGSNLKTEELNLNIGAEERATVINARSYDDYIPLCQDDALDVVVIATPSNLHAPAAILAMENGKHVFTEKPMALEEKDCKAMIDAAKANNRMLMVGHCLRFYPEYVAAHEIMRSGKYGRTITASLNRHGAGPGGWFADSSRSGGVNLDLHIHDIDTALWWWGRPDAFMSRTVNGPPGVSGVLSQWRYDDGPEVQLEASWDSGSGFSGTFRIVLEKATLVYEDGTLHIISREGKETVDLVGRPGGHRAEMQYFISCLTGDRPVDRCRPEESALAVQYAQPKP